jgi:hypothetical protein
MCADPAALDSRAGCPKGLNNAQPWTSIAPGLAQPRSRPPALLSPRTIDYDLRRLQIASRTELGRVSLPSPADTGATAANIR